MKEKRNDLLKECDELTQEIYELALIEKFDEIRTQYNVLMYKIKEIIDNMLGNEEIILTSVIQQMEELFNAIEIGDSVQIIDIVKFELKPILHQHLESIGE